MAFRPSQALVTVANMIFLVCGIGWFLVLLVMGTTYCVSSPECHVITESRVKIAFTVIHSLTMISWLFMRVIRYHDFCAKVKAGIIEMPPRRPPREKIGHFSSIPEALRVLNEDEKLNGWYLLGYAIAFVLIELMRLAGASIWLGIPAVLCFAVPEIHGIRVGKHTLSQTVWIFQVTGSPYRKIAGLGLASWIVLVLYDLPTILGGAPLLLTLGSYPVAELILLASILLWIMIGTGAIIARAVHWKRP